MQKDIEKNVLHVAQGHNHPALFSSWLTAGELNWISGEAPALPLTCTAKTRYRQTDQACVIVSVHDGVALIRFAEPQRAVTPGQAVVIYDGEVCLGGGTIMNCEALESP